MMAALTLGWLVVVPLHDTRLVGKITGVPVSVALDPLTRVLGWKEMAKTVATARTNLLTEGKPVFVIAAHYGATSLLTFYTPEAKAGVPDHPMIYCVATEVPMNQFYFWPGYQMRKGENAIYVGPVDRSEPRPPPALERQFASITDLGTRDILHRDRVFHRVHLFACRDLR